MKQINVLLNSIDKVKSWCSIVTKFPQEMDLSYNRYCIDAKSIMGIFSFDLTKALVFTVYTDSEDDWLEIYKSIKRYEVV